MMNETNQPIGVFDSGVGGLTVLNALKQHLPGEEFIYVGDTARVPYGNKPANLIMEFSHDICHTLMDYQVKAIVIACNSASSIALKELQSYMPVPIYGVIDATVSEALETEGRIGVIGTAATIKSEAYQMPLKAAGRDIWAKDCPMFVPLVEEGVYEDDIAAIVAAHYLEDMPPSMNALILGCTHYPFLKKAIQAIAPQLKLVDAAQATAKHVKQDMADKKLLRKTPLSSPKTTYMVSGDMNNFKHLAGRLGADVHNVEPTPLTPFKKAKQSLAKA